MKKTFTLLVLGYALSAAMFWQRQEIVAWLGWPVVVFATIGVISGIGFYLLVNTAGEGAANSQTYQRLALMLAALYALAACGDYSPVALLSTGPILVGCVSALLQKIDKQQKLQLKNGRRFLVVSIASALAGIGIAAIWAAPLPNNPYILWGFGGAGLLLEAVAQIAYMANVISPKQFRQLQAAACMATLISCLAQSNSGSVAFNAATLLAMASYAVSDK